MALSEEEQRLLEQMEAALAADDPKLANTLRGGQSNRTLRRKRAALAGLGFLAGCVALVAGMQLHWAISVLGFVAMLASTIVAITSWERTDAKPANRPTVAAKTPGPDQDNSFMDKMEERWRKRQGEGF